MNVALYGYCELEAVAFVQVRHAFKRHRRGFVNVRKDYVLVGHNELTRLPFRHPVDARAVRAAVARLPDDPASGVRAAQRWVWQINEAQLLAGVRPGDVLLVPVRGTPQGSDVASGMHLVGGSHEVRARRIMVDVAGRIFALAPALWHVKCQRDPIYADDERWYRVQAAREAPTWDRSARLRH